MNSRTSKRQRDRQRQYEHRYLARLRSRLLDRFGGACRVCGCGGVLEFAHIEPTELSGKGRGSRDRLLDIKRNLQCYTLLCTAHHRLFDSGEIKLDEVPF